MSLPIWDQCMWDVASKGAINQNESLKDPLQANESDPKFMYDPIINQRIYLYMGESFKLPADAIVIGQNEALNEMNDGNESIFLLGGPVFEKEVAQISPIQTGSSGITSGGALPSQFVIHSVGPKFDQRYLTASDHALFSAYKSALTLAASNNIKTIIINCIYIKKKKYPRFDAAHVALRTVRKFLNHFPTVFEKLMFCIPTQDDFEIYTALMTGYFPRNLDEEANQSNLLPDVLGDEWGEVIIADRVLKITAGPQPLTKRRSSDDKFGQGLSIQDKSLLKSLHEAGIKTGAADISVVGPKPRSMADIGEDVDTVRKAKVEKQFRRMSREEKLRIHYQSMVEDALIENFEDLHAMGFLKFVGKDRLNRTVVFITAANFDPKCSYEDKDRVLLYIMSQMENLRCVPYILIYAVSGTTEETIPDSEFIQEIFDLFSSRYKENMQRLFILHASYYFRMFLWLALPFLTTPFWNTYKCVESLKDLNKYMEVTAMDLPEVVKQYDDITFGK